LRSNKKTSDPVEISNPVDEVSNPALISNPPEIIVVDDDVMDEIKSEAPQPKEAKDISIHVKSDVKNSLSTVVDVRHPKLSVGSTFQKREVRDSIPLLG
jgi:hypothetical protein